MNYTSKNLGLILFLFMEEFQRKYFYNIFL